MPFGRSLFNPLFLLFAFMGTHSKERRPLWAQGFGLGLLRDAATGGLFGAAACSFAAVGWLWGAFGHMVEKEDPFILAVWVGLLSGLQEFCYGFLTVAADPMVGWNRWWWLILPVLMAVNGACAFWLFPLLRRFLRISRERKIHIWVDR
ncbi:MAG: rod shape-determining protein MreD [Candidatus Omnitrophica bacterium]|nr:rod shape-determining protein MreD [Candidatus Omnitrophota bacterium]